VPLNQVGFGSEIVERVRRYGGERLQGDRAGLFLTFVGPYLDRVDARDLASRSVPDLYGAALAHLRLAGARRPGEPRVAVYSPDFDEHGYASPHTVVEVVTDDMRFLVDSVTMELRRRGLGLHLVVHPVLAVRRGSDGALLEILADAATAKPADDGVVVESYVRVEVDRQTDRTVLDRIREDLIGVLADVTAAVSDGPEMLDRAAALASELAGSPGDPDRAEAAEFLRWLAAGSFTFLGYREYELEEDDEGRLLRAVPGSGLGILRNDVTTPRPHRLSSMAPDVRDKILEPRLLNLTKTRSLATVHRSRYLDYVGIKQLNSDGVVTGERRQSRTGSRCRSNTRLPRLS
jgi:glutamate dehydrogenase